MALLILWGLAWLDGDHAMIAIACGVSTIAVAVGGAGNVWQQIRQSASAQAENRLA